MRILDNLKFIGMDERVRKFLLPTRIVSAAGTVQHAENLLVQKPLQIGLAEKEYTILENGDDGNHASVVLDFGTELHGGIRLMAYMNDGSAYPEVRITFGESVSEAESMLGEKNATNDHAVRQFVIPVPSLSDQEWGQTGFRFVKLELLSANTRMALKAVLAVFIYRDYPYKGGFQCSDADLNQIFDTAAYTCHLNLQNMVWDGIKRDRLVWIGDMMPESMTVRNLFGAIPLVEESLDFVREQTPLPGWMNHFPSYSMWWILILWDWYMASGNQDFLQKNRDYALGLLNNLCALVQDDGTDSLDAFFLDWPTADTKAAVSGVRALLRMTLDCGKRLAEIYSDPALAVRCADRREKLDLIAEQPFGSKAAAAFLALAGVMKKEDAAALITQNGVSGLSTFMLYFILRAVAENGEETKALEMLKTYSLPMLAHGATTFWEDFQYEWSSNSCGIDRLYSEGEADIHGDFGAYCYTGLRHSLCHGWASGAVPFIMETVLGISILECGCKAIRIRPHLCGLKWAQGSFPTPYGVVHVRHEQQADGSVKTEITAPEEIHVITG